MSEYLLPTLNCKYLEGTGIHKQNLHKHISGELTDSELENLSSNIITECRNVEVGAQPMETHLKLSLQKGEN